MVALQLGLVYLLLYYCKSSDNLFDLYARILETPTSCRTTATRTSTVATMPRTTTMEATAALMEDLVLLCACVRVSAYVCVCVCAKDTTEWLS